MRRRKNTNANTPTTKHVLSFNFLYILWFITGFYFNHTCKNKEIHIYDLNLLLSILPTEEKKTIYSKNKKTFFSFGSIDEGQKE